MLVIPAIDIIDGEVVRLHRGSYAKKNVYFREPAEAAKKWADDGATLLHVVDLDGAKQGRPVNKKSIASILRTVKIPVQAGGGIRDLEAARELIDMGVSRVIIGTRAAEDEAFLKPALEQFAEKLTVSIDSSNGFVMTRGWQEDSGMKAGDFARRLRLLGLNLLIYTAVDADGTLSGPDIPGITGFLVSAGVPVIASGGISGLGDIQELCKLWGKGLCGVIVGKALYEGKLTLTEAINACKKNNTLS